jgi:hypothetical protein
MTTIEYAIFNEKKEKLHSWIENDLSQPIPRIGEIVCIQYWEGRVKAIAHDFNKNTIRVSVLV